ncbi:MAG: hypothetical protein CVU44_06655 [Chloroflexi bacterium HGW-Chloroflexi-6]|nr:MAG: hypothetical protein CVU44_06655 [Chloroflexi bacterium HGW-Chloroflexi-6]
MAEDTVLASAEMTQPVIIDLGRQRPSSLRDLKKGEGKLWDEVLDVADEVKEMLGADAEGKVLIPIVMLYQQKSGRLNLGNVIFPLLDDEDDDDDDDDDEEE